MRNQILRWLCLPKLFRQTSASRGQNRSAVYDTHDAGLQVSFRDSYSHARHCQYKPEGYLRKGEPRRDRNDLSCGEERKLQKDFHTDKTSCQKQSAKVAVFHTLRGVEPVCTIRGRRQAFRADGRRRERAIILRLNSYSTIVTSVMLSPSRSARTMSLPPVTLPKTA